MENVCRTCLITTGELVPLFASSNLPNKIEAISSVSILETDGLPTKICAGCVLKIDLFYNFRADIIDSDVELKKRAQCLIEKENEDILQNVKVETSDSEIKIMKTFECKTKHFPADITDEDAEFRKRAQHFSSAEKESKDNAALQHIKSEVVDLEFKTSEKLESEKVRMKLSVPQQETTAVIAKLPEFVNAVFEKEMVFRYGQKYDCKICEIEISGVTPQEFRKHKRKHFAARTMCEVCGKSVRKDNINKHMIFHTESPSPCSICDKVMKNSESLRRHMTRHRDRPTACQICGQILKSYSGYKLHVKKAHGGKHEKKLKCSFCDKAFYETRDLKNHIRRHTGERPYTCKYCEKGFSSSKTLKIHIARHTNEKPYICELCQAAFRQKVSLRTHMKSKHPNHGETD